MIFFVTVLRALAACLITNSHYTGIYPIDLIANGGLIGDVLFFAISGYCLYNIKNDFSLKGFVLWYGKRIWRVFPPVIIATAVYMLLGFYHLSEHSFAWWYIYPTYYHFVASIIVLYIPFFFIIKIEFLKKRLPIVMGLIAIIYLAIYLIIYDKSYYHIDTVREPMIRFLFMESMLLGAWFRQNDCRFRLNKTQSVSKKWIPVCGLFLFITAYFASKIAFSKNMIPSSWQILNQVVIFALLFFLFLTFCKADRKLENICGGGVRSIISFLSSITLEIYVVQYVLIDLIRDLNLPFPINWICVTSSILLAAYVLHIACKWLYTTTDKIISKISRK